MSKALTALKTDYSPSPLQRAAINRIREAQQELASYGLYPRIAMELEFTIENAQGEPVPGTINLSRALNYLKQNHKLSRVQKVELEGAEATRPVTEDKAIQYEVTLDDTMGYRPVLHGQSPGFKPEQVALSVQLLKERAIPALLRSGSCLNNPALASTLCPNFAARPYPGRTGHHRDTSGLHINVSLIDREGKNAFARSVSLLHACANDLKQAQEQTLLATIPTENSLSRLRANSSTPGQLGIVHGKFFLANVATSVAIRDLVFDKGDLRGNDMTRLENRLPGADADPFVALAVTLSSMARAVRSHVHIKEKTETSLRVKVTPTNQDKTKTDLPSDYEELRQNFAHNNEARELLGAPLHLSLLREYAPQQALAL